MELITKAIDVFTIYHAQLLRGVYYTIVAAILGTSIGLLIGLIVGAIRSICKSHDFQERKLTRVFKKIVYALTSIYVEIIRGTPMMVQAMFLYWSLYSTLKWSVFTAAISIISLNTGAYMSEIIRSGIQSVDNGQIEGARSIGMSSWQSMSLVVLPQAIKNSFPSIGNEFIVNLKDSCVLNCIGFAELFFQAKSIQGSTFDYEGAYFAVGIIYFVLTFVTSRLLNMVEHRISNVKTSFPSSITLPIKTSKEQG